MLNYEKRQTALGSSSNSTRNTDSSGVSAIERVAGKNLQGAGITLAIFFNVMNAFEIFILYLSCGAPFGVYFFFQHRKNSRRAPLILKSFLTVFVWIPYALRLLNANVTKKLSVPKSSATSEPDSGFLRKRLDEIEKRMLQILVGSRAEVSVFEFREVFQRYAGLTLAAMQRAAADEVGENERAVFKIANHANAELGAKCLHRRNRLRLEFHQRLASRDFLKLLAKFSFFEAQKLRAAALEFVTLLDDGETRRAVENLFAAADNSPQISRDSAVKQGEKEEVVVWNATEHKPPLGNSSRISVPLASRKRRSMITAATTTSSSGKD